MGFDNMLCRNVEGQGRGVPKTNISGLQKYDVCIGGGKDKADELLEFYSVTQFQ